MSKPPALGESAKGHRGRLYAAFQLPVHQEGRISRLPTIMNPILLLATSAILAAQTLVAAPPDNRDTAIYQLPDRRITIERAVGITLPDPPDPVVRPVSEPDSAERLAQMAVDWRAQRASHPFIHAGATVYRLPDGKTVTHVTNWSVNSGPAVSFWSSADFSLLAHPGGFTHPSPDGTVYYTMLLLWSLHDIAMWKDFMLKRGNEYESLNIPEFPEGPATWILSKNEKSQGPDAATERAIDHIHVHSDDQTLVINQSGGIDTAHDIHVYLIANDSPFLNLDGAGPAVGAAIIDEKTCWVLSTNAFRES